jgi:hypothetical protein
MQARPDRVARCVHLWRLSAPWDSGECQDLPVPLQSPGVGLKRGGSDSNRRPRDMRTIVPTLVLPPSPSLAPSRPWSGSCSSSGPSPASPLHAPEAELVVDAGHTSAQQREAQRLYDTGQMTVE